MKKRTIFVLGVLSCALATAQGPTITRKTTPGKVKISTVDKNSIFDKAGFKAGDIVREVDGKPVDENIAPSYIVTSIQQGKAFKIDRKGKIIHLKPKPTMEENTEENPIPDND